VERLGLVDQVINRVALDIRGAVEAHASAGKLRLDRRLLRVNEFL
jgi:hypothetical protein